MPHRSQRFLLAISVATSAIGAGTAATTAAEQPVLSASACAHAAYLANNGELDAAETEYLKLLKLDPQLACASAGIGVVAQKRTEALKKQRAGDFDSAQNIDHGLRSPPLADRLADTSSKTTSAGKNLLGIAAGVGLIAGAAVAAFAAVLLVLAVFLRLPGASNFAAWVAKRRWGAQARRRYPKLWPPRHAWRAWFWRPWLCLGRLTVRAFNFLAGAELLIGDIKAAEKGDSGAETVAAALRAALARGGSRSPSWGQLVLFPSASASALNDLADALKDVPQLSLIGILLRLGRALLPREQFTVDATLLGSGARGRGLTVSLSKKGKDVLATETLWSRTYDPDVADAAASNDTDILRRLGLVASGWVSYRAFEQRGIADRAASLGAANWPSFAYFLAGVDCQRALQTDRASILYARAVQSDPENAPAHMNLALAESEREEFDQALMRLNWVIEATTPELLTKLLWEEAEAILDLDTLWYQATYSATAMRLNRVPTANGSAAPTAKELDRPYKDALKLVLAIEIARKKLKSDDVGSRSPAAEQVPLQVLLEEQRGPALALLADAAFVYAIALQLSEAESDQEHAIANGHWLDAYLNGTRGTMNDGQAPLPGDLAKLANGIAAFLTSPRGSTQCGFRAHFNLACFYVRKAVWLDNHQPGRKDVWEHAFTELRASLEGGAAMAQVAQTDPILEKLCKHDGERWAKLLDAFDTRPPTYELSQLSAIGSKRGACLDKAGVTGRADFRRRYDTPTKRRDLADNLLVTPDEVDEWHKLIHLSLELQLTTGQANLLWAVRLGTCERLASWRGREGKLSQVLSQANTTGAYVTDVPTNKVLRAWTKAAHSAPIPP